MLKHKVLGLLFLLVGYQGYVFVYFHARACGNKFADNDILFKPHKIVHLALYRGVGQYPCGFLEGRCRKE